MNKFRVGLTRDFLNSEGELKYDIGLDILNKDPNIEYEFFSEYTQEVMPEQIKDYDAVISLLPKYTGNSFKGVERLVAIARFGVGYDMVDLKACTEADVMCFITPQAACRPVATMILTFMLALSSRIFKKDLLLRSGRWNDKTDYMGWGLTGRVVGSVGLGRISREFFKLAKPLDIVPIAYDPYISDSDGQKLGIKMVGLKTLLTQSDYVSISCPLTEKTYHLIGEKELDLMKPTAFLINTARGPIVDQKALTIALQQQRIQGAALDVFEKEPIDPDDPLIKLNNVILTPHALSWTDESFRAMGEADINGILRVSQGLIPESVVNTEVLNREGLRKKLSRYTNAQDL